MKKNYNYIYGPVPSRRFGQSLGVDLTPNKICSLDCIFCHLGRTIEKTNIRKEYSPIDAVVAEIDDWVQSGKGADYITLAGSGEPTLHTGFGEALKMLQNYPIPSVLLTNGTMLYLAEVREAASYASIVKLSLSAWDDRSYRLVNRPHPELKFDQLIAGQKNFRAEFKGELWMEVMLILGINSAPENVKKIAEYAKLIRPDRIHLNTVVRPPAENFATALSNDQLNSLSCLFDPPAEIIAEYNTGHNKDIKVNENSILTMLKRRPCTSNQIAQAFNMHPSEVSKYLANLIKTCRIHANCIHSNAYYSTITKEGIHNAEIKR